jgi:hypothetical protein
MFFGIEYPGRYLLYLVVGSDLIVAMILGAHVLTGHEINWGGSFMLILLNLGAVVGIVNYYRRKRQLEHLGPELRAAQKRWKRERGR